MCAGECLHAGCSCLTLPMKELRLLGLFKFVAGTKDQLARGVNRRSVPSMATITAWQNARNWCPRIITAGGELQKSRSAAMASGCREPSCLWSMASL